jgi:hypothetical protein
VFDLRSLGQDTQECFPVPGSVVQDHAAVSGDTAKVLRAKSLLDIGEENITGESRGTWGIRASGPFLLKHDPKRASSPRLKAVAPALRMVAEGLEAIAAALRDVATALEQHTTKKKG